MTNFNRAVEVLDSVDEEIDFLPDNNAYITALAAAGLLAPDLPEPDGTLNAVSADGTVGVVALWGHNVDVEAMRNPRRPGKGAITVFGKQVWNPRELGHQILAACDYIEKEQKQ